MTEVAGEVPPPAGRRRPPKPHSGASFWALTLGSVGVVYGDIGTSPLYAFREAVVAAPAGGPVTRDIVLGVLSLILWSLIVVVTLKYVLILLRADNNGEGGTLSLTALASRALGRRTPLVLLLGIIGAAMFLGDSVITPAISVLSAVEGLKLVTPALRALRPADHDRRSWSRCSRCSAAAPRGSRRSSARSWWSGSSRSRSPALLHHARRSRACSPRSIRTTRSASSSTHGQIGLVTLGAVFLVVTGGEALYADLGHFGRKPIQTAWLGLVLPALLINYFGQGALVLAHPAAIENPFYRLVPEIAAAADGRAGDRRDRDREPGGHHRRLFAGAAGDPARPAAAARDPCTPRRSIPGRSTCRA